MWEALAILLCGMGFIVALAMVLVEVPAVLNMALRSDRNRRRHRTS